VSFSVRFTEEAAEDLVRLYTFAADNDPMVADRALEMIGKTWELLEEFPFSCRKVEDTDPFFREVVIPFGASGYVALFEIEGIDLVTVLALRDQLEDDYH